MLKTNLLWLTCLAVALSGPAIADDHGGSGSGQSSGSSSQSGKGGDDHGGGSGGQSSGGPSQSGSGGDHGGASTTTSGSTSQSGHDGDGHGGQSGSSGAQSGDDHGGPSAAAQPVQRTEVRLALTPQGSGVQGSVDIRAQGSEQRLKLKLEVTDPAIADGTVFAVIANGVQIGTVTIHMGEGELEIEVQNGGTFAQGLMASDISSIQVVTGSGVVLLQGVFGSLGSGAATPGAPPTVVKREATLKGMIDPSAGAVSAQAELRVQGAQQQLKIEVDATGVPDGTVMTVSATVNGMTVPIGTATFRLNEAELKLDSTSILPMGIASLSDITALTVSAGSYFTLLGPIQ